MQLGFIGLGKMGANMVQRLLNDGHNIVVYDRSVEAMNSLAEKGATAVNSLAEMVEKLEHPCAIWIMVPSGGPVTNTIAELKPLLSAGDILIDGGNSNYKDTLSRGADLKESGIHYMDVGTSGGIWGLKLGYCMMIGAETEDFQRLEPIFKTLAPENGYMHVGALGAGHYSKMIHNGIEYGMMEAYGEGFEILRASGFNYDLGKLSNLWMNGSVIRSWLLELCGNAFTRDPDLEQIRGYVEDSGEGRWTIMEAIDKNVPAPALTLALMIRFRSRQQDSFSAKVIAALRNEFGGHGVKKKD
ncbi:MAG: decarboxylating 6-phosphogluconate dehydrogenase [Blastocatellia bacterium]|nr:decarboxylating 6-phosphogluconate dehydrogenase [Blastocatellia bacterium]MBL8195407.1 decarboxylating 6-phosphogluconate dehydrogenase [Blastocatellia bacterium]